MSVFPGVISVIGIIAVLIAVLMGGHAYLKIGSLVMKNLSKKHIKHVYRIADDIYNNHEYPNLCYECGYHDCDFECTSSRYLCWWWCPYECYQLANYIKAHKMYAYYGSDKIKKRVHKREFRKCKKGRGLL